MKRGKISQSNKKYDVGNDKLKRMMWAKLSIWLK